MGRHATPTARGTSPRFHQERLPRLLRALVDHGQLGQHQLRQAISRHLRAAGQSYMLRSGRIEETQAAILAACVVLGGTVDAPPHRRSPSDLINALLDPPLSAVRSVAWHLQALNEEGFLVVTKPHVRSISRIVVTRKGYAWVGRDATMDDPDVWAYGYEPGGKFHVAAQAPQRKSVQAAIEGWAEPEQARRVPARSAMPAPADEPAPEDHLVSLQRLCLHLGAQRTSLEAVVRQQQSNIDTLVDVVAQLEGDLERTRARVPATELVRDNGQMDTTISARIRDDEREALAALMRELPQS